MSSIGDEPTPTPLPVPTARSYFETSDPEYERRSTPDDVALALHLQARAADGDTEAMFSLAVLYDQGRGVAENVDEAIRLYTEAAERGHDRAQVNLAYMYDVGRGGPQNDEEAARWYRLAADQGNPAGQNHLASMYYFGRGVERDYVEAEKWFRRAAEQGDVGAQFNLGNMHLEGKGIAQNFLEAAVWCGIAAKRLEQPRVRQHALTCRNQAAARMPKEQREAAQQRIDAWMEPHQAGSSPP